MTQLEFNGMLMVAISFFLAMLIPAASIMLKVNTTLNKLIFMVDVLVKRIDNHDIRLDAQEDNIHNIQINCAKQGHSERNKESR